MPEDQGNEEEKWRGQYNCSSEPVRIGLSLTESHEITAAGNDSLEDRAWLKAGCRFTFSVLSMWPGCQHSEVTCARSQEEDISDKIKRCRKEVPPRQSHQPCKGRILNNLYPGRTTGAGLFCLLSAKKELIKSCFRWA